MTAVSSTIFKIRAHCDYIAPAGDRDLLSFRAGQPFYALSSDIQQGTYFVSTQFAVPFARSAVSGLVPINCFDKVDLLSKDPPIVRRKSVKQMVSPPEEKRVPMVAPVPQQQTNVPIPARKQSLIQAPDMRLSVNDPITGIQVVSLTDMTIFSIKIRRGMQSHLLRRTVSDFVVLAQVANEVFPNFNAENYPLASKCPETQVKLMQLYLTVLALDLAPFVPRSDRHFESVTKAHAAFFNPRDAEELLAGQAPVRRDSGQANEEEEEDDVREKDSRPVDEGVAAMSLSLGGGARRKNLFARSLRSMVFGHAVTNQGAALASR